MIVDTHTHVIPKKIVEMARSGSTKHLGFYWKDGGFLHELGYWYPVTPEFFDSEARADKVVRKGIDRAIVSVSPTLLGYDLPLDAGISFCREINDGIAHFVQEAPEIFAGLATVPLQDPDAAIAELRRASRDLGLRGVQIGTNVEEVQLDHDSLRPFFAAASELGVPVMLHPYYVGPKRELEPYYLTNSIGNPLDTCVAIARLIHVGVPAEFPSLRFLVVHGGGFFPYQIGRFDHAWHVRDEPRVRIGSPPSSYLGSFAFDTVTHGSQALRFLVDLVGEEAMVLGSDIPFDMAEDDPVGRASKGLDPHVAGANALRLYRLD